MSTISELHLSIGQSAHAVITAYGMHDEYDAPGRPQSTVACKGPHAAEAMTVSMHCHSCKAGRITFKVKRVPLAHLDCPSMHWP